MKKFKKFKQKLGTVGIELITLTITGSKVECLGYPNRPERHVLLGRP